MCSYGRSSQDTVSFKVSQDFFFSFVNPKDPFISWVKYVFRPYKI